uniref:Protein toll n=1 Tax=Cacopsylla melanoneura TaxID=428564 RepID=A0A8D8LRJ4_9HEMI
MVRFLMVFKITDGMFNGTHDLKEVFLGTNKINAISKPAFDVLCNHNSQLNTIDLSNNDLEWDSDLEVSPFNSCKNIESLILSNNRISYIHDDWIMGMPNLHELFLDGNNITKLRDYNFTSLSKSMFLDVSNNQIKTVELDSVTYLDSDKLLFKEKETKWKVPFDGIRIVLNENPITCDCSNYGLFYFLQYFLKGYGSKMIDIESQNVTCKPWNTSIDEVHPKTLTCNNVDGCPSLCNCSHSPFYNHTTVDCSSVNLEQMPQDLNVTYKSRTPRKITLILRNNSIQQLLQNQSAITNW